MVIGAVPLSGLVGMENGRVDGDVDHSRDIQQPGCMVRGTKGDGGSGSRGRDRIAIRILVKALRFFSAR